MHTYIHTYMYMYICVCVCVCVCVFLLFIEQHTKIQFEGTSSFGRAGSAKKGLLRLITGLFKIVIKHEQAGQTHCFLTAVVCVNLNYVLTG